MQPAINNFTTAPVVQDYLLSEKNHDKLEIQLGEILVKKENGEKLSAIQLERDFQFQRFFTWEQKRGYQLEVNLTGSFETTHVMDVDEDQFDSVEIGSDDYDNPFLLVDSYSLEDARDGLDIEESRVSEKHLWINVFDLKIKDEFNKNVAPDAGTMIEGGAA